MDRSLIAAAQTRARNLRYSYLFLPGILALGFTALALVVTALDRLGGGDGLGATFPAGPSGARSVLTTIAASLITVAGLAFSITVVTLQLVSQQYTPRAVRNFLGDRKNQAVAGVFVGVFLYCLLVLRTVEEEPEPFVPGLSVTGALLLAFVALGVLLFFIHHMGHAILVSTIASDIANRTVAALEPLYPEEYGDARDDDPDALVADWRRSGSPTLVYPSRSGYVQSLDDIPRTLAGRSFQVQILVSPGDFVTEAHPLAAVWTSADGDECGRALRRAIAIENERDLRQDAGYGVRQLADIAIKALSPSVNDPTTATTCIGYLQGILERAAERPWPAVVRGFPDRDITMVMRRDTFADYLEALVQVGRYATNDARIGEALLWAAVRVAEAARRARSPQRVAATVACGERIAGRILASEAVDDAEREGLEAALAALRAVVPARATTERA